MQFHETVYGKRFFNYLSLQLPLTDLLKQLNIKTNKMKIQVRRMKNDL